MPCLVSRLIFLKSELIVANVHKEHLQALVDLMEYMEGPLPASYLGVPLQTQERRGPWDSYYAPGESSIEWLSRLGEEDSLWKQILEAKYGLTSVWDIQAQNTR